MPELPEVETVRNVLKTSILNKEITRVEVLYRPIVSNDMNFENEVVGKSVIDIDRKGKYLIMKLNDDSYIVSHLRMEGKYFYQNHDADIIKHTHVIIHFNDGNDLRYNDVRKFGRLHYVENLTEATELLKVAPEPWDIDVDTFYNELMKRKTPIKTALLSQELLSGLGNIYVDEVLFASKVLPNRPSNQITKQEAKTIVESSKIILQNAIKHKGTTIRSYTSSLGVIGGYQDFLQIHTKEICPICENSVETVKIGGRTSYFCAHCQK